MTLFRKFLILFRTLFFFIRSELYIKQAEAIDLRLLVTHIQFPASRPRLPDVGCRSSSAPTPSGHRLSRPSSRPRCLRIVLPTEERVPVHAPCYLQGDRSVSRRSIGIRRTFAAQLHFLQRTLQINLKLQEACYEDPFASSSC